MAKGMQIYMEGMKKIRFYNSHGGKYQESSFYSKQDTFNFPHLLNSIQSKLHCSFSSKTSIVIFMEFKTFEKKTQPYLL